jgi:hypothetical protein
LKLSTIFQLVNTDFDLSGFHCKAVKYSCFPHNPESVSGLLKSYYTGYRIAIKPVHTFLLIDSEVGEVNECLNCLTVGRYIAWVAVSSQAG